MSWVYREVQIEDDKSIGDSGTETIDINLQDPLTALIVRFTADNDGVSEDEPPEKQITHVEIIDGGQVYWSLNGPMSVGAAAYGVGRWPHHWTDERDTTHQRINFPLLFGRFMGDEKYAFDPRKLTNPQLRVSWIDQADYEDDSLTLGVTARVMEGLPSPSQCLMWKEIEAWTTAATGTHTIDLPSDYPYRALMMRAWEDQNAISNAWDHFKIDCDVGKFIPLDLDDHELFDILKLQFGPFSLLKFDVVNSGDYREAWMGETLNVLGVADTALRIVNCYSAFWSFYCANVMTDAGGAVSGQNLQTLVTGYFPHNCLLYPFGNLDDPATWFNAPGYKDIDLKIDESDAGFAASVAVQQPRSLP